MSHTERATRRFGQLCAKHPELNGERTFQGSKGKGAGLKWRCVGCVRAKDRRRDKLPHRKVHSNVKTANRRARARLALVALSEFERERISYLYSEALRLTVETGIPHHVDHDVPLARGGTHHPDNLLVVPAAMNIGKGARFATTQEYLLS